MTKLYLDDVRPAPDSSWTVVRSYDEFIKYMSENPVPDIISFDHDLADEHYHDPETWAKVKEHGIDYTIYREKTGLDCVKWLVDNDIRLNRWQVHSMNPIGAENIRGLLSNHERDQRERSNIKSDSNFLEFTARQKNSNGTTEGTNS
jgi:hypothetical protein